MTCEPFSTDGARPREELRMRALRLLKIVCLATVTAFPASAGPAIGAHPPPQPRAETAPPGRRIQPAISTIVPEKGVNIRPQRVTITGTGFELGATAVLIRWDTEDIPGETTYVAPPETLRTTFDLTHKLAGPRNLVVMNPGGEADTLVGVFTVSTLTPIQVPAVTIEERRGEAVLRWQLSREIDLQSITILRAGPGDAHPTAVGRLPSSPDGRYLFVDRLPPGTLELAYWLDVTDGLGYTERFGPYAFRGAAAGTQLRLAAISNPVRSTLELHLSAPAPSFLRLEILDVTGRRVGRAGPAELVSGPNELFWSLAPLLGHSPGVGLYFYRITGGDSVWTGKRIFIP
ncbi:MAG: hypothetical protein GF355_12700 [Candidatus Eisenbacteria bacterium]|nr:hypothetical protein [Candidatus Eisenbacteria bacterium]